MNLVALVHSALLPAPIMLVSGIPEVRVSLQWFEIV